MIRVADPLSRRFARIVALGGAPLALLLALLAWNAYEVAFQNVLDLHRQGLVARQAGLAQVASSVRDHVAVMQAFLAQRLEEPLTPSAARGGLDEAERPGPERGGVLSEPDALDAPGARARLAAAEALFPIQRAAHAARAYLKWSYVFDAERAFIAFYPWDAVSPLRTAPEAERRAIYRAWFDYSVYQFGTPSQDPERLPFWTEAYAEAGASGHVVSHGAPVYANGAFAAVVGADLALSYLTDYLRQFEYLPGKFALIDESGAAIADADGQTTASPTLIRAESLLGPFPLTATQGVFGATGSQRFLILGVPGTPWRLVHTVPYAVLWRAAVLQGLPFLFVAVAMVVTLLALYRVLTREYVRPALRLANYVQTVTERGEAGARAPAVPRPWRPWVGRVVNALGEQTQLMDRLREAEGVKTAVIDSALDAVVIADGDGYVIGFNPGAERIFGLSADRAIGRSVREVIVAGGADRGADAVAAFLQPDAAGPVGQRVEIEARRADGTPFPAEIAVQRVHVGGKDILAAYIRDLTQQRASADALAAQQQRINQIEKLSAMGSLLAGVAHELNNPLAILMAQATLLQDMEAPATVKSRADRIFAAAQRSGRIVKSFLAMARQKDPVRERTQINDIVRGAVEMTGYGLRSAGVEVTLDLDPALPAIAADRDLIGQVVTNLVINAQQALQDRPGERRIRLATRREGETVVVDVADNGPGVPPDVAAKIFDPYFTTKPVGVGTGIGLSICRNVVEAHGGRIALVGAGAGAHFRIVLPIGAVGAAPETAEPDRAARALTVLIVDDEPDVASALAEMIETTGSQTIVEDSSARALERVRSQDFDLVFTDLRMPGMNGAQLRQAIEALRPGLAARTIIMTGDTVLGAPALAGEAGAALVLEKPFTTADVLEAMDRALGKTRLDLGM